MFQIPFHDLRPSTTAHLATTMKLLYLSIDELQQQVESELASNPALELKEERRCPTCHRVLPDRGSCPICSLPQNAASDEPVVFVSPREEFYTDRDSSSEYGNEDRDYSPLQDDLPTFVLKQIAMELAPEDRKLAAYLLAHLNEDGLLTIEPVEVAYYYHVPLSRVENVRKLIQHAEPVGVCSISPQESLIVQLETLAEVKTVPELAWKVINEGMNLMIHRQYVELAKLLNVSQLQIQQAVKFISENLNPYPARSHWGDERQPTSADVQVYHRPDILINFLNDDPNNPLVVEIIMPFSGTLHVNPLFRNAIQQASSEQKEAWKSDLERASLFVKCLQQRNNTMQRLMFRLVTLQKDYILKGEKYLQPVTRVQISKELDVHESTISRAVSNKTVQLPNRRIIPMSSFFDRSLNVRTLLRDIISEEGKPLSDSDLVEILSKRGFDVARRTVAKYRAMEGILPAHLRRAVSQVS